MKTIYKFPLTAQEKQTVMMPEGAEILCAQSQGKDICLWAMINTATTQLTERLIEVFGTGWPIAPGPRNYISTVQRSEFVWHIFELLR